MVENKVNWNTVLIVLVIGVVGILVLGNTNLLSGLVTKKTTITEQVTCVFDGSKNTEKCYTTSLLGSSGFSCSGIGSCIAKVSGESGTRLTWVSSECVADVEKSTTVIDGKNEKVVFGCTSTSPSPCVINNVCEPEFGENKNNCPEDCGSSSIVKANSCDADDTCEVGNLYASGKVSLKAFSGNRNAYACLDVYGNLFRSEKPCPSLR